MKLHLDENVSAAVARGLRERGVDLTTTAESKLLSASDDAHFAFAANAGRVLVSHDTDMLRLAATAIASNRHFAGLAYCAKQKYETGKLISRLLSLVASVTDAEIQSRVEFL